MDGLDALILARIQFAANMTFHILFPTISISLGWVLFYFKLRFVKTGQQHWMDAYQFWVKIFALTFALGVVSGITMSFQFGTNWPGFMETVGNVAGPLLAYEVLTAFFLEATMLGVMLFGRQRVSERMHTLATLLVAGGTTLSAFWILALNSWMHTPAGFEMIDGKAHVTSWLHVIFNPSFPYRFTHMMLASGLTVAFLVAGVSAYRWLRDERGAEVMAGLKTGVYLAAMLIPLQIIAGDLHGLNTLEHQPAKIAAMEGIWNTQKGAPAVLFGMPDAETRSNKYEIAVPHLASLYLTHHWDGEVKGIDAFPGKHPPVAPVFWSFRIMVGMGLLMLAVSWITTFQLAPWKKVAPTLPAARGSLPPEGAGAAWGGPAQRPSPALPEGAATRAVRQSESRDPGLKGEPPREIKRWQAKVLVAMTFAGWVALIAGWYTTEIGRQPWLVSGVLTAAQAASKVSASNIALTLAVYLTLYVALIAAYISVVFYLARHRTHADQPFGDDLAQQPNVMNYPEKEAGRGKAHA
ncbi:MAG: cytochrome ubiquinol oxidase subunit I [Polaromonas sp. 39-63-203]|jgi:cytochrome d ubiquinol oxidase subunit I|uniref:cytochrome ubiquinol oxidase subunit I n=1 Tax=Polaromonas sp. TaxID=1869339 RepID=UPI000BDAA028|nr:cytochrome ubiquinol oxidase subunit I [Polaromonas sp.]OYY51189.1 MAG: cytochrome ubiquinol oxidase subunit I [Polaromonas sp. 35-63-240]OYZ82145.1 MAG: cytochrome ubiquinol oxidase subunit I [Polaromonas sp. 24-62-144]OZA95796.1 MAG: cytochrome ubiquinol oxidase subunit I [Polaromonas sp. 39-63-203]HQS30793.1 cytochrome ubiquinol oxidase subunit I [Polaromonas sp.]HQS91130.1 cytochrome ubiquinol oxidase subunit I [Polaromonas sp.]